MIFNKGCLGVLFLFIPLVSMAQMTYPERDGEKVRYHFQMEIRQVCTSGICILKNNDGVIVSSIVNEFGISIMDFAYSEKKDRVKLHNVIKPLDRWYIRPVLKRSLKRVLKVMKSGGNECIDKGIRYKFTLDNET